MFRKKKTIGAITVLDDDEEFVPDAAGIEKARNVRQEPESTQEMTTEQLQSVLLGTAQSGKDATRRALEMATEAREIGVATAEQMQQQTQQLEKMSEDIEEVHEYLDRSEHLIGKMTKPKLVRMFQRKKAGGKGLDKVKVGRKDLEAREEKKDKGIENVDVRRMKKNSAEVSMEQLDRDRDELFEGASAPATSNGRLRGLLARKKKEPAAPIDSRNIRENYDQYAEPVAQILRQQDDDLDHISAALKDMKELAGAMDHELEYQHELIGEAKTFVAETSRRTKENAKKVAKIK